MLEDILFVVIWLSLPFLWHYLLKAAGLSVLRVSIPGFVIVGFYAFQYVGLPVLYFELNEFRAMFVHDKYLMLQVFFYTSLTITLMILGSIAGRKFFGPLHWIGAPGIRRSGGLQSFCVLALFGVCCAVLALYLSKIGIQKVALLTVLGFGEEMQAEVARSAMGNAFEGKLHWYNLFMNKLLLFCVFAIFAQHLLKPNWKNRLLLGVVFVIATFAMTMAIEKGPMANFLIALFLLYVLVKREGRIPIKGGLLFGSVLLGVLVLFYIVFADVESPTKAIFSVASRAFTGQIQPAFHYLQYFPHHHGFLFGTSFPNPGNVLPFKPYVLSVEMAAWTNPTMVEMGVVGSMPTVYWGEMYANFGFMGVLLAPFFVGFLLYWVNCLMLRLRPDPVSIALFVWLVMHFYYLNGKFLSGYLIDLNLFGALFFFFLIALVSGRGVLRFLPRFREDPVPVE